MEEVVVVRVPLHERVVEVEVEVEAEVRHALKVENSMPLKVHL